MSRLVSAIAVLVILTGICVAAPEPQIIQRGNDWTLDVRYEHPQQILMYKQGQRLPVRYWYTIITLTNKTKDDVEFYPGCELMTDTFQIIPAGKNTPIEVFQEIKKLHKNNYPYLELVEQTENRILQGEDNTVDLAIIWPDFDPRAKGVDLYISGLSNETAVVSHPKAKDKDGQPARVYLRKTLELSYSIGGDSKYRSNSKMIYQGKSWIMR